MYSPDAAMPYPGYEFNPHVHRALQGWPHALMVWRPTFLFCVPLRGVIICRFPRCGGVLSFTSPNLVGWVEALAP
ncbi:hypothetical protein QF022_003055 [Vogesella perlucida]|nr:hypothetical protein [Vogesella perlucida]